ncbi:hypothetical protein Barb7_03158 [Bacteroidales bacterium Barb7]|nr:hypothetical protein Barb7_03158 [Bacteroidales bacterium Barb7]
MFQIFVGVTGGDCDKGSISYGGYVLQEGEAFLLCICVREDKQFVVRQGGEVFLKFGFQVFTDKDVIHHWGLRVDKKQGDKSTTENGTVR